MARLLLVFLFITFLTTPLWCDNQLISLNSRSLASKSNVLRGCLDRVRSFFTKPIIKLDDLLSMIDDQELQQELASLAKNNPIEFADKFGDILAQKRLKRFVIGKIQDPLIKARLLARGYADDVAMPEFVVERLALEAVATLYDSKFPEALNPKGLRDLLPLLAEQAQANGKNVYVAQFDLGNFKVINDILGHEAGDQVIAEFILSVNRSTRFYMDIMARTAREGGDEFVLIFMAKSLDEANDILTRVSAKYNNSDLLESIITRIIQTAEGDPEKANYMVMALGTEWKSKLNLLKVIPGEADFGTSEISKVNLQSVIEKNNSTINHHLDQADQELIKKKRIKQNTQGTRRV